MIDTNPNVYDVEDPRSLIAVQAHLQRMKRQFDPTDEENARTFARRLSELLSEGESLARTPRQEAAIAFLRPIVADHKAAFARFESYVAILEKAEKTYEAAKTRVIQAERAFEQGTTDPKKAMALFNEREIANANLRACDRALTEAQAPAAPPRTTLSAFAVSEAELRTQNLARLAAENGVVPYGEAILNGSFGVDALRVAEEQAMGATHEQALLWAIFEEKAISAVGGFLGRFTEPEKRAAVRAAFSHRWMVYEQRSR